MANFKNYSLKPNVAHFSLSLIGKLITFSDVVHKALVFCFLFIARCKCVHVFTVNKAISAIHRFRLIFSAFQSWVSDLGTLLPCLHPLGSCWLSKQLQHFCSELLLQVGQPIPAFAFTFFRSHVSNKPGSTWAVQIVSTEKKDDDPQPLLLIRFCLWWPFCSVHTLTSSLYSFQEGWFHIRAYHQGTRVSKEMQYYLYIGHRCEILWPVQAIKSRERIRRRKY